jgi:hypothetical protein
MSLRADDLMTFWFVCSCLESDSQKRPSLGIALQSPLPSFSSHFAFMRLGPHIQFARAVVSRGRCEGGVH